VCQNAELIDHATEMVWKLEHDGRFLGIYGMPSNERNSDYCQAVIKISLVTTAPMTSGRLVSLLPHKTVKANMVTTTTSGRS
jgi:hypothetical protein